MATIETNPQLGQQVVDDAKRFVLHSWSVQDALNPIAVAGAEGRYFWDYDGKRYLDFASQLVNVSIGHQHPRLVAAIKRHGAGDAYIYATPDLPEVYFLSGKQNPTRNLFEFLNPQRRNPQDVLALLDQRRVRVVVLSHLPSFSGLDAAEGRALAAAFPDSVVILPFVVRWRAAPP